MRSKTLSKPSHKKRRRPSKPAIRGGTLTAKLVKIGNSRGIRLPKTVIEQAGLTDDVELSVEGEQVVIRSSKEKHPRAGWDEAFRKALAELGPGALEKERQEWADWQNVPNSFDEEEWTW